MTDLDRLFDPERLRERFVSPPSTTTASENSATDSSPAKISSSALEELLRFRIEGTRYLRRSSGLELLLSQCERMTAALWGLPPPKHEDPEAHRKAMQERRDAMLAALDADLDHAPQSEPESKPPASASRTNAADPDEVELQSFKDQDSTEDDQQILDEAEDKAVADALGLAGKPSRADLIALFETLEDLFEALLLAEPDIPAPKEPKAQPGWGLGLPSLQGMKLPKPALPKPNIPKPPMPKPPVLKLPAPKIPPLPKPPVPRPPLPPGLI